MKSTEETRKNFEERIKEALSSCPDSPELEEALAIVHDLDEIVSINALACEYFYLKKQEGDSARSWYDDDDDDDDGKEYNLTKMYEYLIHRIDLFFNTGIHGGNWRNSGHWIAVQIEKMKQAAITAGMSFAKHVIPAKTPNTSPVTPMKPIIHRFPQIGGTPPPVAPAVPTPPISHYLTEIKQIGVLINQQKVATIKQKTNGSFEITGPNGVLYLYHDYVGGKVYLKDVKQIKKATYKETEVQYIADFIVTHI